MCGFIGIIAPAANTRTAFSAGLSAIKARGTTVDTLETGAEQYGYARLPTDDVANGALGRIGTGSEKLLFNGLITNVADLVRLFDLDVRVRQSDTQCLEAGLCRYGSGFLRHVRGMFAAAFITDMQIMLLRDTVGIKPLYYAHKDGLFAFASELKALRALDVAVHEVLPGQIVVYDKQQQTLRKDTFRYESYRRYKAAQIETCLRESVVGPTRRYLRSSKKPVALLLSGGVDSSINAALLVGALSASSRKRLVAFCVGEDDAADVRAAKQLASVLELKFVQVRPYAAEAAIRLLPVIVYKTESPLTRVIKVALLYDALAAAIQQHGIEVAVGGEGADELFFGYQRFIEGLTYGQSEQLFSIFFQRIFPYTLLQRYDRVMARRQIEGRVPYLDQELIQLASRIPPNAKIKHVPSGHVAKLPLRDVARRLGLPAYIYERGKEKMTAGATGRENSDARHGYLEREALAMTGRSFRQLAEEYYRQQFGSMLVRNDGYYTEEEAMGLAARYKADNAVKSMKAGAV